MAKAQKSSALVDTRVIYCGDNLDQLRKLPTAEIHRLTLIYPPKAMLNPSYGYSNRHEGIAVDDRSIGSRANMRPNETQDQRPLARARVAAGKV